MGSYLHIYKRYTHYYVTLSLLLVLTEEAIWPSSTFFCRLFICLWFFFYRGPWASDTSCVFIFVFTVQIIGGSSQFLSLKRFPHTLPAPGHGVFSQTGTYSKGGGLYSGTSFLAGAFDTIAGGCAAVGLGAALGLNLLDTALVLFSVALSFLMLGLVSGSGGLNWLAGIRPIFSSTSRKVFIFLIIVGWGAALCSLVYT